MKLRILPSAEPFFLPGNQTGVLLIHGFTGTPKEMRWMGEDLNARGYTCLGIRLAGHATIPQDMIASRRADWMSSVEDGYCLLKSSCERVFLAGLSMGGVLALRMSARLDVAGVIAMSTPYRLPGDRPYLTPAFLRLLSRFMPYIKKDNEEPGASWFDKEAFRRHVSYPKNPLHSIAELKLLLAEMRAALPDVHAPVLLMHSRNDPYVPPENMESTYAALTAAKDKTKTFFTQSGHILTCDAERTRVFAAAGAFIQKN